jgi:hypothetical protein
MCKPLEDIRKEVKDFAFAQELKLRLHDKSRGDDWKDETDKYLKMRLAEEMAELENDNFYRTLSEVQDELVDIANFAMMLWNNIDRRIQELLGPGNYRL